MINTIKKFFEANLLSGASNQATDNTGEKATRLALAALLIEVAEADFKDAPEEHDALLNIVRETFELSREAADEIIKLARKQHDDSTDYFQFTHLINDNYSAEQKIKLIENLWRIAFSDSHLDKYEEHVIRRIADLIYVSHSDFVATKLRIQNERFLKE